MYEYQKINVSLYEGVEAAANSWAQQGWRVVAALGSQGAGYADTLIIEREIDTNIKGEAQEGTIRHLIDYLGSVPPALWDKPYSILVEQSTSLRNLEMGPHLQNVLQMGPHLRVALKVQDKTLVLTPETTSWIG